MKFLCLIFFIVLFECNLFAQPAAIKILPEIQTIKLDSLATVIVKLENMQQLHAYSIEVSYNPFLLQYKSLTRLDFLSGWQTFFFPFIDTVNGKIRVDEAILGAYSQSGSGNIFKIVFRGVTEGNCALNVTSGELRDLNSQSITAVISNAVIQIRLVVNVSDDASSNEPQPMIKIYPNPFNSITTIQFNTRLNAIVSLKIYNINGEEVFKYNLNFFNQDGSLTWNGRSNDNETLPSGVYFIRLETPTNFIIKKAILLK